MQCGLLMENMLLMESIGFIFPLKTRQEGVYLLAGGIFMGRVGPWLGLMV